MILLQLLALLLLEEEIRRKKKKLFICLQLYTVPKYKMHALSMNDVMIDVPEALLCFFNARL